jgi:hypothetical protein
MRNGIITPFRNAINVEGGPAWNFWQCIICILQITDKAVLCICGVTLHLDPKETIRICCCHDLLTFRQDHGCGSVHSLCHNLWATFLKEPLIAEIIADNACCAFSRIMNVWKFAILLVHHKTICWTAILLAPSFILLIGNSLRRQILHWCELYSQRLASSWILLVCKNTSSTSRHKGLGQQAPINGTEQKRRLRRINCPLVILSTQ